MPPPPVALRSAAHDARVSRARLRSARPRRALGGSAPSRPSRSSRGSVRAMAPDQIEVERKYGAGDGVEAIARRVADLGGSEIGSVTFTDTYDTPECALTANDVRAGATTGGRSRFPSPATRTAAAASGACSARLKARPGAWPRFARCWPRHLPPRSTGKEKRKRRGARRPPRRRRRRRRRTAALRVFSVGGSVRGPSPRSAPFGAWTAPRSTWTRRPSGTPVVEVEVLGRDAAGEVPAAEALVRAVAEKLALEDESAPPEASWASVPWRNCPNTWRRRERHPTSVNARYRGYVFSQSSSELARLCTFYHMTITCIIFITYLLFHMKYHSVSPSVSPSVRAVPLQVARLA